ncbi:DUF1168-domain-containing protein [Pseudovirgaria hyperparasitica]|uniref:DUF1168-domain-containing protein n=1 Tax=Pseudovirgaria hyperparasitica TaxID=470096 RepID=A0A6A6WI07_9PEZI|nr:DUF1168-domain-containing protein [Pseudovirgaria hyperparasitica]KAF2762443.1 DUF1168-domain-containing protein [Pseudovirgaria hyperparasitica]
MSEPIRESIPTSADPRSKRPTKRRALSPASKQASQVEALFAKPDRDIRIPDGTVSNKHSLPPPPEIVANVQGSSAGAGSGEFHVYKASRRREYERIRTMEEEVRKTQEDLDFQRTREERAKQDAAKTDKNRKRREKEKARKQQQKNKKGNGESRNGSAIPQEDGETSKHSGIQLKSDTKLATPGMIPSKNHSDATDDTPGDLAEGAQPVGIIIHDED